MFMPYSQQRCTVSRKCKETDGEFKIVRYVILCCLVDMSALTCDISPAVRYPSRLSCRSVTQWCCWLVSIASVVETYLALIFVLCWFIDTLRSLANLGSCFLFSCFIWLRQAKQVICSLDFVLSSSFAVSSGVGTSLLLVHGQVTIIFVVSVCLSVCLCRVFLSRLWSDFDQTRTRCMSGSSCVP